jgi:hypothetical protein
MIWISLPSLKVVESVGMTCMALDQCGGGGEQKTGWEM